MQKKFVVNLFILLFLNFLIKPFWIFGIDRVVQNTVGAEDYGFYYAIFNLSFLFNILLDAGTAGYNNKSVSQERGVFSKNFSAIFSLRILLAVIYLLVTMSVAVAIGYNQKQIFLLLILGLNQFLLAFILFVRSAFSGLQQYKTDSFLSVLDRVIMIAICGYLLWGRNNDTDFRIEWFVYAQSAAYLITSVFSVFLLFSQTKFITPAFDIKEMKQMLKQSLPYASLVLFMMLTYRLDAVMIERILPEGKAQAGLYAQGFRLFDAFNMIAFLFAGLLLPMFASLFAKKQNIKELADVAFSLLVIPAAGLSVLTYLYSKQITALLYPAFEVSSPVVLSILMLGFIPVAAGYFSGPLLTANGNLKVLNIIAVIALLINLVLNFVFIPVWKAEGAAWASLISQMVITLSQFYICARKSLFVVNIMKVLKILFMLSITILAAYFLNKSNIQALYSFIGLLVFYLLMAFGLKQIDATHLLKILKTKSEE